MVSSDYPYSSVSEKSNQCFSFDPQHVLKSYALAHCNNKSNAMRHHRVEYDECLPILR